MDVIDTEKTSRLPCPPVYLLHTLPQFAWVGALLLQKSWIAEYEVAGTELLQ